MKFDPLSQFSPVSRSEWLEAVRKTGGADPGSLVWDAGEGFEAEAYQDRAGPGVRRDPLYHREEVKQLKIVEHAADDRDTGNMRFNSSGDGECTPLIHARVHYNPGTGTWESCGFPLSNSEDLRRWLSVSGALRSTVFLDFGAAGPVLFSALKKQISESVAQEDPLRHSSAGFHNLSLLFDPFTQFLDENSGIFTPEEVVQMLPELLNPGGHSFCVDGTFYANAGATLIEQVAFITALFSELLARLQPEERSQAAKRMLTRVSGGPLYFPEIAKLRAIRLLWGNLLRAFDLPENWKLEVIAETSLLYKTGVDLENNLVRNTAETMASVAGGADYLLIHPHTSPFRERDDFPVRMADNLFHILKEEAAADAVSDPAAGSYYIEYLTDLIAEKAWSLFQQIEAEGGFLEAIKKGSIQKRIRASADKRAQDVVSGERKILGVNLYSVDSPGEQGAPPENKFTPLHSESNPFKPDKESPLLRQWADAQSRGVHIGDLLPPPNRTIEKVPMVRGGIAGAVNPQNPGQR